MHLSFTFRNMDANATLKDYAREKVERIQKYFPDPIKVQVIFSQERGYLYHVDVQITLHNGLLIKGTESTEDTHSSIDLVMAKIERQLRRYKDRIRNHKVLTGPERAVLHRVVAYDRSHIPPSVEVPASAADQPLAEAAVPLSPPRPRIIKEEKFITQPMSVEEAIMRMNLLHESLLCFNNIETHEVNVVYRRDDDTYGLIETTHEELATNETAAAHQPS